MQIVDIFNPVQPIFASCGTGVGYINDPQRKVDDQTDTACTGRETSFISAAQLFGFDPALIDNQRDSWT